MKTTVTLKFDTTKDAEAFAVEAALVMIRHKEGSISDLVTSTRKANGIQLGEKAV